MIPIEIAVEHALAFGKVVRSKLKEQDVSVEALLLELKQAKRRIDDLLAEIGGRIPILELHSTNGAITSRVAQNRPVLNRHSRRSA